MSRPLPLREAAGRLGVSPVALRRAAAAGRVRGAERVGRGWEFDPDVLELRSHAGRARKPGASEAVRAITGGRA